MSLKVEAKNSNACSICLDDMPEEDAKKLICDHLFHEACIGKWLETAPTCPLCRLVVTNLTPMPRPAEMSIEELLAVPDDQPINPFLNSNPHIAFVVSNAQLWIQREMALFALENS